MKPIISPNIRMRHPEYFLVGEDSIVDDFCYFSTKVKIGRCSHIASGCSIAGGLARQFTLGDYSSLSSGVKIWCTSDDFVNDIVTILPLELENLKSRLLSADVTIEHYCAVGSNSVIMPGNHVPVGTVIGALSFVPTAFEFQPWGVYAGIPIRWMRSRNKEQVTAQAEKLNEYFRSRGQNE
ncbi:MAG TPA: hypothetical protein VFR47_04835 [Anaerolineales bacterium]|nr:hypothetical protein [Anaerolineales bacterium]